MNIVDQLIRLFTQRGQGAYFGEAVTETEHALQTAHQATEAAADDALVAAALLHDVGHLLHGLPEDIAERGFEAKHEEGGALWLARYFPVAVIEPIRLHVAAKRYLCAVDDDYYSMLSSASRLSLRLQGGAFSPAEVEHFEKQPYWEEAVELRRWDDAAKVPGLVVPGLVAYRSCLEQLVLKGEAE